MSERNNVSSNKRDVLIIVITSISNHLESNNVIPQDNFLDIGGDSLSAMKVKIDVEEKLNITVPLEEVMLTDSIDDLVNYILERGEIDEQ